MSRKPGRPDFRQWVDKQADPQWPLLPLTHVTSGLTAQDIIRAGEIVPQLCTVFGVPAAYFFYGRPAYRVAQTGVVKLEAACPFCFIFKEELIGAADAIHAFDTGAFAKRLYAHVLTDEMNVDDYSLGTDVHRPNKLIAKVFASTTAYFDGDRAKIVSAREGADAWEFHARAYIELLDSPGRNEPDDRICSIEVAIADAVPLRGNLLAVVVPHTLWDGNGKHAPWLEALIDDGVVILPYTFIPGRAPEHYHDQLEAAVRSYYRSRGIDL